MNALSASLAQGPKGRLAVGLVLIAGGLLLIFDQAGIVNFDGFGRFWPLLLIGIGIVKVRQPIEDGQRAVGTARTSTHPSLNSSLASVCVIGPFRVPASASSPEGSSASASTCVSRWPLSQVTA